MFNTSMIENKLGRCTYQYDGGSLGRYNRGCGTMAFNGDGECADKSSAWFNIDPKTGEKAKGDSDVVLNDYCPVRISKNKEPKDSGEPPCFWKGPAFYSEDGTNQKQPSETHDMLEQRIRNQDGIYDLMTTWDEVVIDSRQLYYELRAEPAQTVIAMLYHWSPDHALTTIAKNAANAMAIEMQKEFNMKEPVPLVAVDTTMNITEGLALSKGPFFFGAHHNPDDGPCCFNGCDAGACSKEGDYCGQTEGNCIGCGGTWCPTAGMPAFLDVVV
jgi:hypothetical protein